MQNRLKSKVAWLAVASLIGFILGNYGLYDAIGLTNETFQQLINLLFACLTAFGVFNNPTEADKY